MPYIRARAQDYYERLGGGQDPENVSEESPELPVTTVNPSLTTCVFLFLWFLQYQRAFKLVYPYANLALDLSFLSYDLRYLFGQSDAYRPWHSWLWLRVERRGPDDQSVCRFT